MASFVMACFICSFVRATLPIFSMTSTLVQKLGASFSTNTLVIEKIGKVKICQSVRSRNETCNIKLSLIERSPAVYFTSVSKTCHQKFLYIHTYTWQSKPVIKKLIIENLVVCKGLYMN